MQVQAMHGSMQSNATRIDSAIAPRGDTFAAGQVRWSPRRSILFILLASLSLWAGIIAALLLR